MAGLFFCHACLDDKDEQELSPDPRYCQGCYEFLLREAEMLAGNKRPAWIPKPHSNAVRGAVAREITGEKPIPVVVDGVLNMSTSKGRKSTVDKINPSSARVSIVKRGRKRRNLPEDIILELHKDGLGSKAIATQLKRELGIDVSYKTIQRVLSGERNKGGRSAGTAVCAIIHSKELLINGNEAVAEE